MAFDRQLVDLKHLSIPGRVDVESRSTHADQGDLLVALVARDSIPIRVKRWRAIYKKQIPVMTMMEFQAGHPATIGRAAHGSRGRVPSIEIAYQGHVLNTWGIAEKRNVMLLPSG